MRLLKYLLATLLAIASPASAGWLPLNEPSTIPVSNACSTASGTTITFTAQGVGGTNPNRITVVTINWDDSTNAGTAQLTAMSVGGISMAQGASASGGVQNSNSEIWYAANPSGTTANIVATFATAVNGVTIEVYSLVGYTSVPIANTAGTTSVSQAYNNKQVALATASRTINVSTSLSNMLNDFSSACGANLWGVHASQSLRGNNQTLTSTISPTSNNPKIALAIWSTQPSFVTWDSATTTSVTLSNGNLTATNTGTTSADQGAHVIATSGKTSGKYYAEFTTVFVSGINNGFGVGTTASTYSNMGNSATTGVIGYYGSTTIWANGSSTGVTFGATGSQTYAIAVDLDNRRMWFKKVNPTAGTWNNSGTNDPATNVGGVTIPAGTMIPFCVFGGGSGVANNSVTANFGGSAFTGAVPSGFTSGWPQ